MKICRRTPPGNKPPPPPSLLLFRVNSFSKSLHKLHRPRHHRQSIQKFARFPDPQGGREKARKKRSDPSLLFIQSRKNEPWEKEGWLVLEEGGQGMMSAVIETEERMREGETKREREKKGSVESRKVSTTYCRPPRFSWAWNFVLRRITKTVIMSGGW